MVIEQWGNVKLKDISKIEYGKSPNKIRVESSDYPIYGTSGQVGYAKSPLFKAPLILIGRKGTIDKPFYINKDCWIIDTAYGLSVDNKSIDLKWLYYFLSNFELAKLNEATGVPSLNRENLYNIKMLLPTQKEQQKIATILSSVDDDIEKTEAIIEQTEKVKKGLMQQILTIGIGHKEFVKTHVGSIPASWKVVHLSNCSQIKSGVTKGRKLSDKETFPVPYLRVANVQDGYLDLSEIKYIDVTQEELERYALEEGDILLTEGGDADKLGRGYIWHSEIPNCIHQNHVFRVRVDRTMIIPEYLAFLVGSEYGKSYFLKCAKQTTNLASINSTQLKAFPVLLPPQNEQIEIVKNLNSVNAKIKKEQETLANLQTLKQGLMQSLLTGKVRVKVDEAEVEQV
ncbi:restriction endonuclease subunit S [Bacillus sp. ISL-4]|uniref:restriction endonuclease subunit S n=1 Tax=Bacillus sp. ISL-4 TaxID=2819125 RepID=UPI001BEB13EA|nr:restriction endonuclease subunit S [Bacillus sp. ISL-4]MBT2663934.1 restriction endonuclease subunit S [Bacillus sp. ISL-4]MBT2672683.1 restriction endonuclease subunit S [Streptomyces sp. ISL-14]